MNGSNLLELETLKWPLIKLEKGSSETYIRNSENRVPVFYIFFHIFFHNDDNNSNRVLFFSTC